MSGGRPVYYEVSCPKCGKPSIDSGRNALNKVGSNPKKSKKARCRICRSLLKGSEKCNS